MEQFTNNIHVKMEHQDALYSPYVQQAADDEDGSEDADDVYPMSIHAELAKGIWDDAYKENEHTPASVLLLVGKNQGLLAYESEVPGGLIGRVGEVTTSYLEALQKTQEGQDIITEDEEVYQGMNLIVCKVIQFLAKKLRYSEKCRTATEYEEWESWERASIMPIVMASPWVQPVYAMLPYHQLLTEKLSQFIDIGPVPKAATNDQAKDNDDGGRRATRLLDIPKEEDTTPAETLVMLKNIKGAENRAKTITSMQFAINKNKKLRQKFNTWLAQRTEEKDFEKLTQAEKIHEFIDLAIKGINKPVTHMTARSDLKKFEQGKLSISDFFEELEDKVQRYQSAAKAANVTASSRYSGYELTETALEKMDPEFAKEMRRQLHGRQGGHAPNQSHRPQNIR